MLRTHTNKQRNQLIYKKKINILVTNRLEEERHPLKRAIIWWPMKAHYKNITERHKKKV